MLQYVTTRTYYSKQLNEKTIKELKEIAQKLSSFRKEIWHRFSSNPKKLNDREIRDTWLNAKNAQTSFYPKIIDQLPARLWKETLRDTISNINAYFEAGFAEIIKKLYKKYGKQKAKELAKILKTDYKSNNELHRLVRKTIKKGQSKADDIICLDADCYSFKKGDENILLVTGLTKNKRLQIPLTTKFKLQGSFKLIIRENDCELKVNQKHDQIEIEKKYEAIGVDKGYTEVFTDSEGNKLGKGLGELLTNKTNYLNEKYKSRNKLFAIMKKAKEKGDAKKANNIKKHNLGNKKLNKFKEKTNCEIKEKIYKAAKEVAKSAKVVAIEDLSFQANKSKFKSVNRLLNSWMKSIIDEAMRKYCFIYDTKLVFVNAAYTSQGDHRFNCALAGVRNGDTFTAFDGVVFDADLNAALNILARLFDLEITLYTSVKEVKEILKRRANEILKIYNQNSVETAQPRLQLQAAVNISLNAKSELSLNSCEFFN